MKIRFFTWQAWTGFLLCLVALFSYPFFFVRFPLTRDFPWANLLLYCVASTLIVIGLRRSFGIQETKRRKIVSLGLTILSVLVFALFIFVVFVFPRQLPSSASAPQPGQKAPSFSLADTNGKTVALSELLNDPIDGKSPRGVLIVF